MVSVYSFFDESGKFHDSSVVAFGGVCGREHQVGEFEGEWQALLRSVGSDSLSMKHALKHQFPLGQRVDALGVVERTKALLPFVECAKKYCELILGTAIDVSAFTSMSPQAHKQLTHDPYYASFARNILEVIRHIRKSNSLISVICDDDEGTAEATLKLYRKVKLAYGRDKLISLSFSDDNFYHSLQAADMVSSLIRLEARKEFFSEEYPYRDLYLRLTEDMKTTKEASVKVGLFGRKDISKLSEAMLDLGIKHPEYENSPLVEKAEKKLRKGE